MSVFQSTENNQPLLARKRDNRHKIQFNLKLFLSKQRPLCVFEGENGTFSLFFERQNLQIRAINPAVRCLSLNVPQKSFSTSGITIGIFVNSKEKQ
jgi:hypothetical protein